MIPIVYILTDIIICNKGLDSNYDSTASLNEAFHYKDCNEFCWKSLHLIKVIIGLILLIIYIATSIIARPHW